MGSEYFSLVHCNSYLAFAVHGSRASPRTACALTVHPELVEGFFEIRRQSTVTGYWRLKGLSGHTNRNPTLGDLARRAFPQALLQGKTMCHCRKSKRASTSTDYRPDAYKLGQSMLGANSFLQALIPLRP